MTTPQVAPEIAIKSARPSAGFSRPLSATSFSWWMPYEMNQVARFKKLEWQRGFGVVSFGKKQLPWVRAYIKNQKEHHASRMIQDRLERVSMDDDGSPLNG